jgi:hypothetical protein
MTISFPRELPSFGGLSVSFELARVDYLSPEQGGRLLAVTAGFPLWRMSLSYTNLSRARADALEAWRDSLRGVQRTFYAWDHSRPVPRFHANGIPFNAAPSGWSQAIDADGTAYLTLTGLLAGQVVSYRDYVGFVWDTTKRSLVRAIEPAQADAAGSATFAVEPPVPPLTPPTAAVTLRKAECLMRLVTGETQLAEHGLMFMGSGGRIVGIQDLRA